VLFFIFFDQSLFPIYDTFYIGKLNQQYSLSNMTTHHDQQEEGAETPNKIYEIYKLLEETQSEIDESMEIHSLEQTLANRSSSILIADEDAVATQLLEEDIDDVSIGTKTSDKEQEARASQTSEEDTEINDSPIGTQIPNEYCMPTAPKKQKKE
jgi:hypothetical protein